MVGGFFCYYRQMLCLVKRGEERTRRRERKRAGKRQRQDRGREVERENDAMVAAVDGRGRDGSERDEATVWKVGGSGTGKKLGTKHDISLAESGHFLPRLFRRVLRLASGKKFRFSCAKVAPVYTYTQTYTTHTHTHRASRAAFS